MSNLENSRYQQKGATNYYGELCTRAKYLTGEKINGIPCCHGLMSEMTDELEDKCRTCASYLVWNMIDEECDE